MVVIGCLLLIDAYYLGHVADACNTDAQKPYYYLGTALLVVFIGLVVMLPFGKSTLKKLLYSLAKLIGVLVFIAALLLLSFSLCF